jgi:tetratricopeptide (TPR) repeat protein
MAELRRHLDRARAGNGQVVLIEGEPGVGKSRILSEFLAALADPGAQHVLVGSYALGGAASAVGAFTAAFREHFAGGDLGTAVAPYLGSTPALVPAFTALLRGDAPPPGAQPLTKDSLHTAFVQVARALAEEKPTVIATEDLHHAPEEGRGLFAALALATAHHPILLVGTTRPGLPSSWMADLSRLGHVSHLTLARLAKTDLAALLAEVFPSAPLATTLIDGIAAQSDGNPFFVFELLGEIRRRGLIHRGADGNWVQVRAIAQAELPASVSDLIGARLSALRPGDRELLELAACAGFEFDPQLVAEAMGDGLIPALKRCARLDQEARLLRPAGRRYTFDHHLIQEHLYEGLFAPLREQYHAVLGEALEKRVDGGARDPGDLPGGVALDLCAHFLRGGRPTAAHRYLGAALDHLERTYQNAAAADLCASALAHPGSLTPEKRVQVRLRQATSLDIAGRAEEEHAALADAAALAAARGDPGLTMRVWAALGRYLMLAGQFADAEARLRAALELGPAAGDLELEARVRRQLGDAVNSQGDHARARVEYERCIAIARATGNRREEAKASGNLALALGHLGEVDEARTRQESCLAICREIGDRMGEQAAAGNLGNLLFDQGQRAEGIDYCHEQLRICREIGYRRGEAIAIGNIGVREFHHGAFAAAQDLYERHLRLSQEIGFRQGEAIATGNLGVLYRALGRLAESEVWLARHLALCREIGYRRGESVAESNLGELAFALGRMADARAHYHRMLDLNAAMGNVGATAFALQAFGAIAEAAGEWTEAEAHYRASLRIRTELGHRTLPSSLLALGALLARRGKAEEAATLLGQARSEALRGEMPDEHLLAELHLARLSGDLRAALRVFTASEERVNHRVRLEGRHLLWELTGDAQHLTAARQLLAELQAGAPPADRELMVAGVPLYQAVAQGKPLFPAGDGRPVDKSTKV